MFHIMSNINSRVEVNCANNIFFYIKRKLRGRDRRQSGFVRMKCYTSILKAQLLGFMGGNSAYAIRTIRYYGTTISQF